MFFKRINQIIKNLGKNLKPYQLEEKVMAASVWTDMETPMMHAVSARREFYTRNYGLKFDDYDKFPDYSNIYRKNCENVIGYTMVPTGIVGPMKINGIERFCPMATTEGALVGSVYRGINWIHQINPEGFECIVEDIGISRAPIVYFDSLIQCENFILYVKNNFDKIKKDFESTTSYGKLKEIKCFQKGNYVHLRLVSTTGDAMGMNMISIGTDIVLNQLKKTFPNLQIITLSGNMCTDKKASSVNWILGRGKKVIIQTKLNIQDFQLKTGVNVQDLITVHFEKNLYGSAMANNMGGNNAHISNMISSIFIATGQDTGQVGTSSMGIFELAIVGKDLVVSLTMPCLEVATIGGGTKIQDKNLKLIGIDSKNHIDNPGQNVKELAETIGGVVLSGELSLLVSLTKNTLVESHKNYNR